VKNFPLDHIFLILVIGMVIFHIGALKNTAQAQTSPLITSSRSFFDISSGDTVRDINTSLPNASSILNLDMNACPIEIAIYIHGVWASKEVADEQTKRVALSLNSLNYTIPVIGFSWDSNTPFSLENPRVSQKGWQTAKIIANKNGPLLAQFITDFKEDCPTTDVRIIAHSLGSRVVFSALQSLQDNRQSMNITNNDTSKKIKTVHLLGAAVDNEQASINPLDCILNIPSLECSGRAIESEVQDLFNLYNTQDNMVAPTFSGTVPSVYEMTEDDEALGGSGAEDIIVTPSNYNQTDVKDEILADIDANGDGDCDLPIHLGFGFTGCSIFFRGDNHFGYMGYRSFGSEDVHDNGAMNVVVTNWRNS
jgi:hypothetical protein